MTASLTADPVRLLTRNPDAAIRLVCFPYAGGGLSAFRSWRMPAHTDLVGVQLPGREDRFHEQPFDRMTTLVDWLGDVLDPYLTGPYAFFGHSMGARIAFTLARRLRRAGRPGPRALFVSGSPGPCLRTPVGGWNEDDDGLIGWLRRMDGTPREILEHPDILDALLPTLRADLTVVATHPYRADEPLAVPVHAFAGRDDDYASPERMAAWRRETSAGFRLSTLPGGHFFLTAQLPAVLAAVRRDLDRLADPSEVAP